MTRRANIGVAIAALLLLSILLPTPHATAFSSSQIPAIRIGEQKSASYGVLNPWGGLTFDNSGNLWVADSENNRVLGFLAPFSDNMNATFVIGQPNFQMTAAGIGAGGMKYPTSVAFDAAGDLWVADTDNSRVLGFDAPVHSGMNATVVLGQFNFSTAFFNTTRNGLSYPWQLAFDSFGNLWVADRGNGRVLEYQPPFITGMNASSVIGEPDFVHRYCQPSELGYNSHCSNHSTLTGPGGIAFDPEGDLWITESYAVNGRLLEFKHPFKNGMQPTLVMQPVFASAIAFDPSGNMWLACPYCYGGGGGDALEYRPPFGEHSIVWENGSGLNATLSLVSWTPSTPMSRVLVLPLGLAFDSSGNLWVVDSRSSWLDVNLIGRVVGYDAQVHPLDSPEGRVYFQNKGGLLAPLSAVPLTQMNSINFPEGLFNFTIQGLPPGGSVDLTITFPHPLMPGTEWLSKSNGRWFILPANQTSITGNNMTLILRNASQTGAISAFGGPAYPPPNLTSITQTASTSIAMTNPLSLQNANFPPTLLLGAIAMIAVITTTIAIRKRRGHASREGRAIG